MGSSLLTNVQKITREGKEKKGGGKSVAKNSGEKTG